MKKHTLFAVAALGLLFAGSTLLPGELSPVGSAYAKGGNGGGNGGGHGGNLGGHSSKGHGSATSGIASSRDSRGLSQASAISATTPGDHNSKGLSNAIGSSTKNDR
ncbi:TPA: hypothetical protein SLU74_003879 [Pseudomonas aeruginosa]|uniref:hypothetical protein n=2 Tax=Pseudomonas aeruginosa TaxID=287 RepID=UPI00053E810A|nr:hypothetical protein [Pseudomonas aeruginosa]KXE70619.1 hypothetical protein AW929_06855 [Pseudomonas aeruginosa]KXE71772.1 hypothetical protein AW928_07230 [Pseudomonas aeruginosa]KXE85335.1 hypothetical protein AW931_06870 [Pseudomonas aeruginosa]KXE86115.1 hypothetical protein AW930_06850 [Pseudomonas aeruginosa]MBH3765441.1 hypothetical protein [Pseudomonas aeruginosa]